MLPVHQRFAWRCFVNSWFVWPDWFRKNWITASEWILGFAAEGERWSSIKNPISIQALPLYSRDIACVSKYPLAHWYYPTFTGPIEAVMFNVGGLPLIMMGCQTKRVWVSKKTNHPHYVTFTNQLIPSRHTWPVPLRHDLPGLARPADEREDRTLRTHLCCFERSGNWWVLTDVTLQRVRGLVVWSQIWDLRIVSNMSPETRVSQKKIHLPTIPFDWPW